MATVTIPSFYQDASFSGNDQIPFWRTVDRFMFRITYNDMFTQIESSLGGSIIEAWHGLKKLDNSIGLGGYLNTDISINANQNIFQIYSNDGNDIGYISLNEDNKI